jgi:hypothetical protein
VTGQRLLLPWIVYPIRLISWMEILKFSASQFYTIADVLASLEAIINAAKPDEEVNQATREKLTKMVTNIGKRCEEINLSMSLCSVERLSKAVGSHDKFQKFKGLFEELNNRIHDEIQDNLFLFIPKTHVRFYEAEQLFTAQVEAAFPSATYDIKEAGKCLALRRNTASVCHVMRILEIGLRALAKRLRVPYENKPWNYVIEVAEKRLNRTRGLKRKPRKLEAGRKILL